MKKKLKASRFDTAQKYICKGKIQCVRLDFALKVENTLLRYITNETKDLRSEVSELAEQVEHWKGKYETCRSEAYLKERLLTNALLDRAKEATDAYDRWQKKTKDAFTKGFAEGMAEKFTSETP
jgi:hypothetical protein